MTESPKRVLFYTRPSYLDSALPLVLELSRLTKLHLMLEITPEGWSGPLGLPRLAVGHGLAPAKSLLAGCFPTALEAKLGQLAGFDLVVYTSGRAFFPSSFSVCWQVESFIRRIGPDVVHLDDVSGRCAPLLPMLHRRPVVVSVHDPAPHSGEAAGRAPIFRRLALRQGASFILHSEYGRNAFAQAAGSLGDSDNLHVVPLGTYKIYKAWMEDSLPEEPKTVLLFGRLSPYKGIETFLSAAEIVASRIPGTRFIIAGAPISGYAPPTLPRLANNGEFELHIERISNSELCRLFQRAALVVLPYTDATQSGVVSTAYAFHKPVIATTVGGLPEVVENDKTGKLVPPSNPAALANAIVELLQDSKTRSAMANNISYKEQDELSMERLAEMTMKVYRCAISSREAKSAT